MCDFTKGIKLCSCGSDQIEFRGSGSGKPDNEIPLIYIWKLARFVQKTHPDRIGKFMFPSDSIGEGLNAETIVGQLNAQNCFDFDYSPLEGDCLRIQQNTTGSPFISFIFRSGEWRVAWYRPFTAITKQVGEGTLKEA